MPSLWYAYRGILRIQLTGINLNFAVGAREWIHLPRQQEFLVCANAHAPFHQVLCVAREAAPVSAVDVSARIVEASNRSILAKIHSDAVVHRLIANFAALQQGIACSYNENGQLQFSKLRCCGM